MTTLLSQPVDPLLSSNINTMNYSKHLFTEQLKQMKQCWPPLTETMTTPCAIRSAATTHSTSIPPFSTNSPSTNTNAAIAISPFPDAQHDMTNTTQASTASLQEIFQHQLHLLQNIKEQMALLCTLIDRLICARKTPLLGPQTHLKSSPYDLTPNKYCLQIQQLVLTLTFHGNLLHSTFTQKPLTRMKTIMTPTKTTAACGCPAIFRTKDYLCPP